MMTWRYFTVAVPPTNTSKKSLHKMKWPSRTSRPLHEDPWRFPDGCKQLTSHFECYLTVAERGPGMSKWIHLSTYPGNPCVNQSSSWVCAFISSPQCPSTGFRWHLHHSSHLCVTSIHLYILSKPWPSYYRSFASEDAFQKGVKCPQSAVMHTSNQVQKSKTK